MKHFSLPVFAAVAVGVLTLAATTVYALSISGPVYDFDPTDANLTTALWIQHIGLPDPGGEHNYGLLVSKNTTTATNASAGVNINGVNGITLTELGFDIRNGGHCGAGAPRYNVVTDDNVTHFFGCIYADDAGTPAPGWTRKRFNLTDPSKAFPPIQPGSTVKSISLVFDEGTDTGPDYSGYAILDNLDVNGVLIPKGPNVN